MSPRTLLPGQVIDDLYLATPRVEASPGVLLLHAWWGLTPFFQLFCNRLASEGFVVLAPDLYHGVTASTVEEAKRLRSKLKKEIVAQEIIEAAAHLRDMSRADEKGIGLIGFSLGGYWALWLAEQGTCPIAAAVVFYASRNGEYTHTSSAFQFHLAETDEYVAASGVKKLQKSLRTAGREAEFYTYPATTHWFMEQDRADAYQAPAAELAWDRMAAFLRGHLK